MKPKLSICIVVTIVLSACGAGTPVSTATLPPSATATITVTTAPTLTSTATLTPTKTPKPTATPNMTATQQYNDFFAVVQKAYDAGQISTMDGEYVELDSYSDEIASKLSYTWTKTGVSAKNFIYQADFMWNSAEKTTNTSGCGLIFRIQSNEDHYLILLDAFSGVKLASSTDVGTYSMGSPTNGDGRVTNFGAGPYEATFTLVVNELKSYVYLNHTYVGEYKLLDYRINESGPIASAVLSATDVGYGTRCTITNGLVWVID